MVLFKLGIDPAGEKESQIKTMPIQRMGNEGTLCATTINVRECFHRSFPNFLASGELPIQFVAIAWAHVPEFQFVLYNRTFKDFRGNEEMV